MPIKFEISPKTKNYVMKRLTPAQRIELDNPSSFKKDYKPLKSMKIHNY